MQSLKTTLAEIQLRYRISRLIGEVTSNSKVDLSHSEAEDAVRQIKEHPVHVLTAIKERLNINNPTANYLSLRLLEYCVNAGSFSFHCLVAQDVELHKRLIRLAADRADNDTARKVRSAARHIILEFSRMFADEEQLKPLARLAAVVEEMAGRGLVRSVMMEKKRVKWRMPDKEDYCDAPYPPRPQPCSHCGATNRLEATMCFHCKASLAELPPAVVAAAEAAFREKMAAQLHRQRHPSNQHRDPFAPPPAAAMAAPAELTPAPHHQGGHRAVESSHGSPAASAPSEHENTKKHEAHLDAASPTQVTEVKHSEPEPSDGHSKSHERHVKIAEAPVVVEAIPVVETPEEEEYDIEEALGDRAVGGDQNQEEVEDEEEPEPEYKDPPHQKIDDHVHNEGAILHQHLSNVEEEELGDAEGRGASSPSPPPTASGPTATEAPPQPQPEQQSEEAKSDDSVSKAPPLPEDEN